MADEAKKILIAEDDHFLSKVLRDKLEAAGYEITVASDGAVASELIKEMSFDLVLLDLLMPNKDGYEVLLDMRLAGIKVPVAVLSNLSSADEKARAEELGAKEYIVKSDIPLDQILQIIEKMLK